MRPFANPRYMPMLHRVEMNVVDMKLEVGIITNGVLPVTTLPNPSFAPGNLAAAALHLPGEPAREAALNQAPSQRKIGVAPRQGPEGMYVVRQYADGDRPERIPFLHSHVDTPEPIDMPDQDVTGPVGESDGEKEGTAFNVDTTISRHDA